MSENIIINRDCLLALRDLPDESVNCCVTSPPYYALRDYGMDAQIGREDSPEEYIRRLVLVFREVRRILTEDGTLWLNIADTYCGTGIVEERKAAIVKRMKEGSSNRFTWRALLCPWRRAERDRPHWWSMLWPFNRKTT